MIEVSPATQIMTIGLFAILVMTLLWFAQNIFGNAGIVDLGWSTAIGISGIFAAATSGGDAWRRAIAAILIGLWASRLTIYLFLRMRGKGEESRYARLRAQWGRKANRRLFYFFQIQAIAVILFVLPILIACWNTWPFSIWDLFGIVIWVVGFTGVVLADLQLERFKHCDENRGKTCREGLWKYSRHPNYFFEWLIWWCWVPLTIGASYWSVSILLPLLLLYLLLFKTGIPPSEAQAIASRGDDYRHYQTVTSAFIPWWPKKESST